MMLRVGALVLVVAAVVVRSGDGVGGSGTGRDVIIICIDGVISVVVDVVIAVA